ncbi:MAG TPA: potassium-transporting ATPase subunit KdpA, partial [Anaerolineales bacterium]|nr:potassium-transporting ATPase subunit KdpA [Anaerolineales bacterium]
FVIVAVFVAGLMVGRTPEYLGKKIEAYDRPSPCTRQAALPTTAKPLHTRGAASYKGSSKPLRF